MLLELLIDPTSSIIFQRIKSGKNLMECKSRRIDEPILNLNNIIMNVAQGFLIFIVVFVIYIFLIKNSIDTNLSITIAYSILTLSIMLIAYQLKNNDTTISNFLRSFRDKVSLSVNIGILIILLIYIYLPFFNKLANTSPLSIKWWLFILLFVFIAILPFDIFKILKSKNK